MDYSASRGAMERLDALLGGNLWLVRSRSSEVTLTEERRLEFLGWAK